MSNVAYGQKDYSLIIVLIVGCKFSERVLVGGSDSALMMCYVSISIRPIRVNVVPTQHPENSSPDPPSCINGELNSGDGNLDQ